jgi:hypothetical protein
MVAIGSDSSSSRSSSLSLSEQMAHLVKSVSSPLNAQKCSLETSDKDVINAAVALPVACLLSLCTEVRFWRINRLIEQLQQTLMVVL